MPPKGDSEIVPWKVIEDSFRLEDVTPSPAYFDLKKLAAVETLGTNGAGLTLLTKTNRGPICSHGEFASVGEDLQLSLGEGPCRDAFETRELVESIRAVRVE